MYYQKVDQGEDGDCKTIRIRPSNHHYTVHWNDFLLNLFQQQDF